MLIDQPIHQVFVSCVPQVAPTGHPTVTGLGARTIAGWVVRGLHLVLSEPGSTKWLSGSALVSYVVIQTLYHTATPTAVGRRLCLRGTGRNSEAERSCCHTLGLCNFSLSGQISKTRRRILDPLASLVRPCTCTQGRHASQQPTRTNE